MTEFAFVQPEQAELEDALEGLEQVLQLDEVGEVDLPPSLRMLLEQLEDVLSAELLRPPAAA